MAKKIKKLPEEIMKEDFDRLPPLPKEFDETVEKLLAETRRLFYKRIGSKAEYHCTHCGADYMVRTGKEDLCLYPFKTSKHKIPVENEIEICDKCGTEAILKAKRRWRWDTTWREIGVWQCIPEGMIFRSFYAKKEDNIGNSEDVKVVEHFRAFFYMNNHRYYHYIYGYVGRRWEKGGSPNQLTDADSTLGDPQLMYKLTELRYCPLDEMLAIANKHYYSPDSNKMFCMMFQTYSHFPGIELELKIGLEAIADRHITRKGIDGWMNKRGKTPADIYRVYPERVRQLRGCSISEWKLYQFERKEGYHFNEEELEYLKRLYNGNRQGYVSVLLKYMSPVQMKNRLEKYLNEKDNYGSEFSVIMHYTDYLEMRQKLGYDMTNSVYLYPRNLRKAHDKMVKEEKDRKNELRLKEVLQKYDIIPQKFRSLKKKYGFEAYGYIIRPAKDAAEIVREGWALHHCVGGDGYLNKHNTGRTAILFMRSADHPDKPYVTIEVDKDRILQWYGAHDKKNVTKEAKRCIDDFEKKIALQKTLKKSKKKQVPLAPADAGDIEHLAVAI